MSFFSIFINVKSQFFSIHWTSEPCHICCLAVNATTISHMMGNVWFCPIWSLKLWRCSNGNKTLVTALQLVVWTVFLRYRHLCCVMPGSTHPKHTLKHLLTQKLFLACWHLLGTPKPTMDLKFTWLLLPVLGGLLTHQNLLPWSWGLAITFKLVVPARFATTLASSPGALPVLILAYPSCLVTTLAPIIGQSTLPWQLNFDSDYLTLITESQNGRGWKGPLWVI